MRKIMIAVLAAAISLGSLAAHADTYIKMRLAGAGDFFISETSNVAFVYPDGAKEPTPYTLSGHKQDCRFYKNDTLREMIAFCSNQNRQSVWIGMTGYDDKTPTSFELDKRYIEEVQIGQ